jgi:DNA-binding NarL/FixJ family response regulator
VPPRLGRECRHDDAQSSDLGTFVGTRYRTLRMGSIRVVLAEDNALLREGISRIIDGEPDLELVGQAVDLPELLELIEDTSPEVVVTDIRMPPTGTDEGIQAASWLREHKPEVGVVVLSQYKTPSYALALLETGSAGRAYLLKEQVAGADELAQAIRTVAQSGSMIDPQIVDELIAAKTSRRKSDLSWLTPRESEILGEMAKGKSNAAIAASLHVSERAVEKHTNSIFSKLGLTEERDVNRRVKAVLVYLSDPGAG